MPIRSLPWIAFLTLAALPVMAQTRAPATADVSLSARMQAFLAEVEDEPNTELAAFFPRRGDWTWVQTRREFRGDATRTRIWRFPAAQTPRVIGEDGPACQSFDVGGGHFGPVEGTLGMHTLAHRGSWRRVRGNRFVPPGASAASPVFVEWRREDGVWVVSAFGDESVYFNSPRVLGRPAGAFSSDTALVPEDVAFARADWHMITLEGRRYLTYGLPRALSRDALTRISVYERVSVYVQRGADARTPALVYLPTSAGVYQPYETHLPAPCR